MWDRGETKSNKKKNTHSSWINKKKEKNCWWTCVTIQQKNWDLMFWTFGVYGDCDFKFGLVKRGIKKIEISSVQMVYLLRLSLCVCSSLKHEYNAEILFLVFFR